MKRMLILTAALVAMLGVNASAYDAHGSAFGNFATAQTLGQGKGAFGGGIGIADATSFFGWFNYGLSNFFDGRIKLGMIDVEGADSKITFGADARYQFGSMSDVTPKPFDMALSGFAEYVDYEMMSVFQVGGAFIGSYPLKLNNGSDITPYGRFNLRLESVKMDSYEWFNPITMQTETIGGDSESKIRFGVNAGVAWQATPTIKLYGEFQLDGNDGLFLGAEFGAM